MTSLGMFSPLCFPRAGFAIAVLPPPMAAAADPCGCRITYIKIYIISGANDIEFKRANLWEMLLVFLD